MSGDGDLDGGISRSGGDGVLGACCGPGKVRTMGGGEGGLCMFGMKSANKFRARANGTEVRPNAESSEGMSGLKYGPPRPRPTGLGGDGALLLLTRARWGSGAGCRGGFTAEYGGPSGLGVRLSGQSGKANWSSCLATYKDPSHASRFGE